MTWQREKGLTEAERLVLLVDCSLDASSSPNGEESACNVGMGKSSLGRKMGEA